jgi:hypothetical protein
VLCLVRQRRDEEEPMGGEIRLRVSDDCRSSPWELLNVAGRFGGRNDRSRAITAVKRMALWGIIPDSSWRGSIWSIGALLSQNGLWVMLCGSP